VSERFVHTVLLKLLANVSSIIYILLALKLYRQHVTQEVYGLFMVLLGMLNNLALVDGGFRLTLNRNLLAAPRPEERRRLLEFGQTLYSIGGLFALVAGILLMVGYGLTPAARVAGQPLYYFAIMGTLGGLTVISAAQCQLLIGLGMQSRLYLLNILNSWGFLGGLWLAFRLGLGNWAFVVACLISTAVPLLLALLWIRLREPELKLFCLRPDAEFRARLRALWPESSAAFTMQVLTMLLYSLDLVVAQQLCNKVSAGIYALLAGSVFTKLRTLLQAADEAIWPFVARGGGSHISVALVRLNAWLYGAVLGGVVFTLPAFIRSYMDESWMPTTALCAVVAARYLITGLSSQPSYYLLAHGKFREIAISVGRELVFMLIAAAVLSHWFDTMGVALGCLLGTLGGAALPLPRAYARAAGVTVRQLFPQLWLRALLAAGVSGGLAYLGMQWRHDALSAALIGGSSAFVVLAACGSVAALRTRQAGRPLNARNVVLFI
jgi:O-antigen/teichoic acid export membrane protein